MKGVPFNEELTERHFPDELIRLGNLILGSDCLTKEYSITGRSSDRAEKSEPLFPAIAIPVESKAEFECPDNHFALLQQSVKETTKILIIGWRGMDAHFLELLLNNWHADIRVQIVCGTSKDGDSVQRTMEAAGLTGLYKVEDFGFTNYARDGHAEKFLNQ
jgi:hypothetical protein